MSWTYHKFESTENGADLPTGVCRRWSFREEDGQSYDLLDYNISTTTTSERRLIVQPTAMSEERREQLQQAFAEFSRTGNFPLFIFKPDSTGYVTLPPKQQEPETTSNWKQEGF